MKVIIAGSRCACSMLELDNAIMRAGLWEIDEVVSGTARGADALGEKWAAAHRIDVKRFPADWDKHGKSAGYKRNIEMANYADALIALWDGESRGAKHMIEIARSLGLKVHIELVL